MVDDVNNVHYSPNVASTKPQLEALYVGSRVAVLLSKYGLGCGWDDHPVPLIKDAAYYDTPSADSIGLNLVAYAIGYNRVGMEESKPELFAAVDEKHRPTNSSLPKSSTKAPFNVHPNSATTLLSKLRVATSLRVNLKRVVVDPARTIFQISRFSISPASTISISATTPSSPCAVSFSATAPF